MAIRKSMHLLLLFCFLLFSDSLYAKSSIRFPVPEVYGENTAIVYDDNDRKIGKALLSMKKINSDMVLVVVRILLNSGLNAEMKANLKLANDKKSLHLISQQAYTLNEEGHFQNRMFVDHINEEAVCINADNDKFDMQLPERDQIVNIPLNLLLKTVAAGKEDKAVFQTLVCGDKIELLDTSVERTAIREKTGIVETRYRFDLGVFVSLLAMPFVPRISFWFESGYPYAWVGHRMPLYSNGPTVLVLRKDYLPEDL